jgi:RNA polymerase sigma factor (sigma-70 family)
MSRIDSREHANDDVENLFLQDICPIIPKVVGQVCSGLVHYPGQTEIDDFIQEINESLLENDRHVLRSFDHRSRPQTWLYAIVRRHILHRLQKRVNMESLEDMPLDSSNFIVHPDQEKRLLAKEMEEVLQSAFSKLTEHERKLLVLRLQERSRGEIAKKIGIKKESVSREINAVINKLQRIVREDYGI